MTIVWTQPNPYFCTRRIVGLTVHATKNDGRSFRAYYTGRSGNPVCLGKRYRSLDSAMRAAEVAVSLWSEGALNLDGYRAKALGY